MNAADDHILVLLLLMIVRIWNCSHQDVHVASDELARKISTSGRHMATRDRGESRP